jgi:hypothetical protein
MSEKVNGWSNRETWLVNLWYGDSFASMIENEMEMGEYQEILDDIAEGFFDESDKKQYFGECIEELAERYESWVYETIQPELDKLSGFLSDLLTLDSINWFELARDVFYEYFIK